MTQGDKADCDLAGWQDNNVQRRKCQRLTNMAQGCDSAGPTTYENKNAQFVPFGHPPVVSPHDGGWPWPATGGASPPAAAAPAAVGLSVRSGKAAEQRQADGRSGSNRKPTKIIARPKFITVMRHSHCRNLGPANTWPALTACMPFDAYATKWCMCIITTRILQCQVDTQKTGMQQYPKYRNWQCAMITDLPRGCRSD